MYRRHRIRLYPTKDQEAYFIKCAGASRHAWNWALALRKRYYRRFKKTVCINRVRKKWCQLKKFGKSKSWAAEVGKVVTAHALLNLESAFKRFFFGQNRYPKFKSKHRTPFRFTIFDQTRHILLKNNAVKMPIVGRVRCKGVRQWENGVVKRGTILREGGRWFLSVLVQIPDPKPDLHTGPTCGIDLGCTTFATIASEGRIVYEVKPPKPYAKAKRRLKRLQRQLSRRKKGSKNREKSKKSLGVLHWRIANKRRDFLQQLSRMVVGSYGTVVLEDLNMTAMFRGRVSKTVFDLGMAGFRDQIIYKAIETGTKVIFANRMFPSSKMCSVCGVVNSNVVLGVTRWTCSCGAIHNRDHNAALNLEKLPQGMGKVTPAETGVPTKRKPSRSRSKKQESSE